MDLGYPAKGVFQIKYMMSRMAEYSLQLRLRTFTIWHGRIASFVDDSHDYWPKPKCRNVGMEGTFGLT